MTAVAGPSGRMRFRRVALGALAYALPDDVWSSRRLEQELAPLYERVRLSPGRLELMTGIRERRFWPADMKPSAASILAGRAALDASPIGMERLGLLAHCAVCRDQLEPATAAMVHEGLGLPAGTMILDVSNACLGFLNGMVLAAALVDGGQIEAALLVSGENGRPLVERTLQELLQPGHNRQSIKPFFANLTIGAGAVAAVVAREDLLPPGSPRLVAAATETDSSASALCQGDTAGPGGLEMQTDSEELLEAGVAVARRCWARFEEASGWSRTTPDRIVCHQVGRVHRRRLYETLDLDVARDFSTFETLGNVGSVSLPLTLAQGVEANVVQAGDRVALLGIGSGLACMMMAVEWGSLPVARG